MLWGGLALSAIGDQAYNVAFAWIATEAFGTWAGFLAAVGPLAQLAMLVLGGGVADALPPGRAMVWADGVRALALLLVVAMASAGLAAVGGPMQDITVAVLRQTELARADVPAATRAMMAGSQLGLLAALLLAPALLPVLP